jgi:hypothetical protein
MFSEKSKTRAEVINLWTQVVGILAAGWFGYYQFVYKEVRAPKAAPVNVSVDLAVDQLDPVHLSRDRATRPMIPIRVRVGARNPSTREVALFPTMVVIFGEVLAPQDEKFEVNGSATRFEQPNAAIAERYAKRVGRTVIAFGKAFADEGLKPNEAISRTFIVHIPSGRYDRLEAVISVTAARSTQGLAIEYKVNAADPSASFVEMPIYEVRDGKRSPLKWSNGEYDAPGRELQQAVSRFQLSLPDEGAQKSGSSSQTPPSTSSSKP